MSIGAAQFFGCDHLTGCSFHQWRTSQKDGGLVTHHNGLVSHRRHISTTGRTRAHDHGYLWDALRAHIGLVEENAAEMLAVRKYLILVRQVGTTGIHQVNTR